jgi:CheY-like chemotaxis protein
LAGKRVLLMDQDPFSRQILEQHLRYCGMFITHAANESEFDVILLSTDNPNLEAIRSKVPIVLLTSRRESAQVLQQDGKQIFHLLKPIRRARLLEFMNEALGTRTKTSSPRPPRQSRHRWNPNADDYSWWKTISSINEWRKSCWNVSDLRFNWRPTDWRR